MKGNDQPKRCGEFSQPTTSMMILLVEAKFTYLEIWYADVVRCQLDIVIKPSLHQDRVHIDREVWKQRPVGILEDGEP